MKSIYYVLQNIYQWNKKDFWIINILSFLSGVTYFLQSKVDILIYLLFFLLTLVKASLFIGRSSILPTISANNNSQFSWKYLQSLPLEKRDLLKLLVLSQLFSLSPLMICLISNVHFIWGDVFEVKDYNLGDIMGMSSFVTILLILITCGTISQLIQLPRLQFSRYKERAYFYQRLKNAVFAGCALIYVFIFFSYFDLSFLASGLKAIGSTINFLINTLGSWLGIIAFTGITFFKWERIIKVWQNETLSYVQIKWTPKKDIPITAFGIFLLALPIHFSMIAPPLEYRTHELLTAIYNQDLKKVNSLTQNGADLNLKNEYGLSPLLAAASGADIKIFKLLEQKGATRNSNSELLFRSVDNNNYELTNYLLNTGASPNALKGKTKSNPLHVAANRCNEKMVELLVAKGANVREVNHLGETALHVASLRNCLSVVISLGEAGANPLEKTLKGKTALDLAKSGKQPSQVLNHYLEKISRRPANVTKD